MVASWKPPCLSRKDDLYLKHGKILSFGLLGIRKENDCALNP